ncbi:MAG: ligand-binding protein, partial [Rectinemataceae bacterium]|nr:ligand-binding protein [Rectinemataceae bacterium]
WDYYVGLAGGFDPERNSGQKLDITDVKGNKKTKDRIIQPEDNLDAPSNSVIYGLFRVATILTTILSLASLVISFVK